MAYKRGNRAQVSWHNAHCMQQLPLNLLTTAYRPAFSWHFLRPRYWPSWCGLALLWLGIYAPRPLWNGLGAGLGDLYYWLNRKRRCIAMANIERCFPELTPLARQQLVRAHFRVAVQSALDLGWLWWASRARLQRHIQFSGIEHYAAAVARGQRIILLTCHTAGMEMGALISLHYPQIAIFKPVKNPLINWLLARGRARFGAALFVRKNALRHILRAFTPATGLYYLPDEDLGGSDSVFAPFFGEPAATLATLGRIAQHSGATAVLPYFPRRRADGRGYELVIKPPLQDFPSGDKVADAHRMNGALEQGIREAPAQYLWTFKRFKNRPAGAPSLYDRC